MMHPILFLWCMLVGHRQWVFSDENPMMWFTSAAGEKLEFRFCDRCGSLYGKRG